MNLKREISLSRILFASISAIIGSGWLFGALYAAQLAGPASILAWIIGGIAVIFLAFCFAELATMFPLPGGVGIFPLFSHGEITSFAVSWTTWIAFILITPIEIQAVVQYASNYVPNLMTTSPYLQLTPLGFAIAFALLIILVVINSISVKFMSDTNFYVTIWKLIIPIGVIFVFLMHGNNWGNLTNYGGFAPYGAQGIFASLAMSGIILAFNGFQPGISLAGETQNPQRNIPIAVVGSVIICMLIYCLLQFSFLIAIPPQLMSSEWSSLNFAGAAGPLAGLLILIGVPLFAKLLYADALVSPMGTAAVFFAASVRTSYAMSFCRYLPKIFQKTNKLGIPIWGVVANFLISAFVLFSFHGWQEMVAFYAAAICFSNAFIPLTLIALRSSQPNIKRPFKIPYAQAFAFMAFYISNMMYYWCGWETIFRFDITLLTGIILYMTALRLGNICARREKRLVHCVAGGTQATQLCRPNSARAQWLKPSSIVFLYIASFSILSKLGAYGGLNIVKTDKDYIIIGIISFFIFILSQRVRLNTHHSSAKMNDAGIQGFTH